MKNTKLFIACLFCFRFSMLPALAQRYADGLPAEQSMKTFQLPDQLRIEPFAVEPDVLSPVDMAFDEFGQVYVVEMGDYPYEAQPGNYKGRIRLLKDTNGDGKPDKSYIFAENLPSATSILPWKAGLIVCAAPDILYLKDTNGDHKADQKQTLFTGFFAKNSEAQITCLRFGVDNWIYANNHGQAGTISFSGKPGTTVNVAGGDFRFRLDKQLFEVESGTGQFGLAIDEWGHRFYTQNTLHIQQAPLPYRYARRHEFMPSYRADVNISDHELEMFQKSATPYWRQQRSDRRQAKYDSLKTGYTEWARDHFTGASGGTFYGGDGLPSTYYGSIFTGEVAGNLVHRDVLSTRPGQPAYVASRGAHEKDKEFLASTDTWFRPTNFYTGPDGYLYMTDMYRQHIETPVSIPEDLKTDMDFLNGEQKGRIWRIYPAEGQKRAVLYPMVAQKSSAELVALLSHPNQWWRLTAQRLLLERQDKSVVAILKTDFEKGSDPRGRLHALYTLEGLGAIDGSLIKRALTDAHPGVREHGIMLAESDHSFLDQIISLCADESSQVAFQACLSLGQFSEKKAIQTLADVLIKNVENGSFRQGVLSSVPASSVDFLTILTQTNATFFNTTSPGKTKFIEDFGYICGARNKKNDLVALLTFLTGKHDAIVTSALTGLTKGIRRSGGRPATGKEVAKALTKLEKTGSANLSAAIDTARKMLQVD